LAQQQHCIGLTEFLIPAGKSLPNRDPRVQLLKSFDRSKDFDEWAVGSDAILFERFSRQRGFPQSGRRSIVHFGSLADDEPSS